jgi:hypothetical protein
VTARPFQVGDRVRRTKFDVGLEATLVEDRGDLLGALSATQHPWGVHVDGEKGLRQWAEHYFELVEPTYGPMTVRADQLRVGDRNVNPYDGRGTRTPHNRDAVIEAISEPFRGTLLVAWAGWGKPWAYDVDERVSIDRPDPDPDETITLKRSEWVSVADGLRMSGWAGALEGKIREALQ